VSADNESTETPVINAAPTGTPVDGVTTAAPQGSLFPPEEDLVQGGAATDPDGSSGAKEGFGMWTAAAFNMLCYYYLLFA
jgi:hypothetical protein